MMDFNSSSKLSERLSALIAVGLRQAGAREPTRSYLGASRLGVACERALQYEYAQAPIDPGRELDGRVLRVFERGKVMEEQMAAWLRQAGFVIQTRDTQGEPIG